MCPSPEGEPAFKRPPDARTRQIQIRNRQQELHTAEEGEWQARVRFGGERRIWNCPISRQLVTLMTG